MWPRLIAWASAQGLGSASQQMMGLLHSNPDLIPYEQCRYVACLTLPQGSFRHHEVGVMDIPGGLYASCRVAGEFGDLLYVMRALYLEWLCLRVITRPAAYRPMPVIWITILSTNRDASV
ncbi:MAG: GyrI-like domain-containing protein [Sedimenticola sp.]